MPVDAAYPQPVAFGLFRNGSTLVCCALVSRATVVPYRGLQWAAEQNRRLGRGHHKRAIADGSWRICRDDKWKLP